MSSVRRSLPAVALTATLFLTACGDEPAGEATDSADPTAAGSPTPAQTEDDQTEDDQAEDTPPAETETQAPEPPPAAEVPVTIEGDDVSPMAQTVEIPAGGTIVLDITSDRAGELHVHSSPEQTPSFEAGESVVEVTLDRPGQVDIEEHESGALIVRALVQ